MERVTGYRIAIDQYNGYTLEPCEDPGPGWELSPYTPGQYASGLTADDLEAAARIVRASEEGDRG